MYLYVTCIIVYIKLLPLIQSLCCKSQHNCLISFLDSEETENAVCQGLNDYLKCIINLDNAEVEEVQHILQVSNQQLTMQNYTCSIDQEIYLMFDIDPLYLRTLTRTASPKDEGKDVTCLNSYMDTLILKSTRPDLICQSLILFFKCNRDNNNTSVTELEENMNVFKEVLSGFQLTCELNTSLFSTACEISASRCLVSYFEQVLKQNYKNYPVWTCRYTLHFTECIAQSTCCFDTIEELMYLLEGIENKRTGYHCGITRVENIPELKKNYITRRLAVAIAGSYQVALSETVRMLLQDYP